MKQIVDIHPGEGISNRVIKLILSLRHRADLSQPVYLNWRTQEPSIVRSKFYDLFDFTYDCEVIEASLDTDMGSIWGNDYVLYTEGGGGSRHKLGKILRLNGSGYSRRTSY